MDANGGGAAAGLRMLAVHAHADDETITMGGTFATYAARGVHVCNVCCTDGQLATIVAKDMDEETTRPRLGEIRREELRAACAVLGVERVEFLGYGDSGMPGTATNQAPGAFWVTPLAEVVERLVRIIREFRPHVVLTYDAYGGYGHPDHIQTHRAALLAVEASHQGRVLPEAGAPWRVEKLYYTAFPRSVARRAVELARQAGMPEPFDGRSPDELEFATDDDLVTTTIDIRDAMGAKRAALLAHHSQIDESFPLLAVPEEVLREQFGEEHFSLALSRVPVVLPETDLFAGVAPAPAPAAVTSPAAV